MLNRALQVKPRDFHEKFLGQISENATLTPKYNGWRLLIWKDSSGRTGARFGKTEVPLDLLEKYKWFRELLLLQGTVIDGELHGDCPAGSVLNYLQNGKLLTYSPFAYPFWNGEDRRSEPSVEHSKNFGIPYIPWGSQSIEDLIQSAKRGKYEGWVLKNFCYKDWWKIKVTKTVDCVISAANPGRGNFHGMVGSFTISLFRDGDLVEVGTASGFTLAVRRKLSSECIGKVIEVRYNDVLSKGKLQHARFLRFREDKSAEECTFSQLENFDED